MHLKIKEKLLEVAKANPGIRGKFKMAAGVVYKNKLLCIGINQYKTHPIMLNDGYREQQIYLHAEADAIVKASRLDVDFNKCCLYVVRIDKKGKEMIAKPCNGCMNLITQFGIGEVKWTI